MVIHKIAPYIPPIQYFNTALIAGILISSAYTVPWTVSSICLIVLSTYGLFHKNKTVIASLCCFFIGVLLLQNQDTSYTHLSKQLSRFHTSLQGTITNQEYLPQKKFPYKTSIATTTTTNKIANIWIFSKKKPTVHLFDSVAISNQALQSPPKNSGLQRYMKKEGVAASCFINQVPIQTTKACQGIYKTISTLFTQKENLYHNIMKKLPSRVGSMVSLIFFGNKLIEQQELTSLQQNCLHWGISHFLARSGLHIIILFALLNWLLSLCYVPLKQRMWLLLALSFAYMLLTWMSISFLRAFIMIIFCILIKTNKYQYSLLHLINLTCFLVLIINPYQLFFLDFQLSFSLTYILIVMNYLTSIPSTIPLVSPSRHQLSSSYT